MRDTVRITFLAAFLAAFVLFPLPATSHECCPTACAGPEGIVLAGEAESALACRILVERGPSTVVDRGMVDTVCEHRPLVGSFRYWEEPSGRMLYVYDDVQNLVVRVVNPQSVTVVGILDAAQ